MRGTHCPTTSSCASCVQGSGSKGGTSTTFVSSRPSTSTLVTTKRLSAMRCVLLHRGCRILDRLHDLRIRAATAEVAGHRRPDVLLGGRRVLHEEQGRGHELSRSTET